MAPDYSEVLEALNRRVKEQGGNSTAGALAAHVRTSRMVSLKLEELLKSDEWNTFLSHAKALLEVDEAERDRVRENLERGGLPPDELFKVSNQLQRILGRIEARREDLELPRAVIQQDKDFQVAYAKTLDKSGDKPVTE